MERMLHCIHRYVYLGRDCTSTERERDNILGCNVITYFLLINLPSVFRGRWSEYMGLESGV